MKRSATISLAITIGLLVIGYLSLEPGAPTQLILLPGILVEDKLAPSVSPGTIGIGGPLGLAVDLAVSGVAWFFAIFPVVAIGRKIFRCSHESRDAKNA